MKKDINAHDGDPKEKKIKYDLTPIDNQEMTEEERNEWLDIAFAPLLDYLDDCYTKEKDKIMGFMMFMGHETTDGSKRNFIYKNNWTRSHITFNELGEVLHHQSTALNHDLG